MQSMQISNARVENDPLAQTIQHLVDAMKTDFGDKFLRAYGNPEDLRQLKRRLYAQMRGFTPSAIVDAYEALIAFKREFLPTVPEIVDAARKENYAFNERKAEKIEAERFAALPPPKISVDPIKLLHDALENSASKNGSKEDWLQYKADMLKKHEAVIAAHISSGLIRRNLLRANPACGVSGCRNFGGLSHSTTGTNEWYCREHYRA